MKLRRFVLTVCIAILWTKFLLANSSTFFGNPVDFSPQSIAPVAVTTPASSPLPTPPIVRTWRERVQEVARAGSSRDLFQGRSDRQLFYPRDYDLPKEYYNGLAYYVWGTGESYIIYKQGLSAPPLPREWWGTQYEIAPDAIKTAVRSGEAIVLSQSLSAGTFNTLPPPGSDQFLVFSAEESDFPQVVFLEQGISIKSTTLSVEEMKRILRSGRPIPAQDN